MASDRPVDPLQDNPHEDRVQRVLIEVRPEVQRVVLELYRVAEEAWNVAPIDGCHVWREEGDVVAARLLQ